MEKITAITKILFLFFVANIILNSCEKNGEYYGTYYGTHLITGLNQEKQSEGIFLTVNKDYLLLGENKLPYKKVKTGEDSILFELTIDKEGEKLLKSIAYLRGKDMFVFLSESGKPDITLMRHEKYMDKKTGEFVEVDLSSDLSILTEKERQMLPYLFKAAQIMDDIFWKQAYGDKNALMSTYINESTRKFIEINYGPWERLNADEPFLPGIGSKPAGANFYPVDMTTEEFESMDATDKTSLYTLIRRNENGELITVPYHQAYETDISEAASLIKQASELAEDPGLKKYLELRAEALLTDDYLESDMAWMEMKTNTIDFVVGPIESYEDGLYGYKAAHEAFILIKDKEWSEKLDRFAPLLPALQKKLPVPPEYKKEIPGSNSDLCAYDVIFYAGDCNAGSKTIAINLPNDERISSTRKLQLKNAMTYKFEKILVPISNVLITEDQRKHVTPDAFFENTMFHEVAHGLGINNTINGKGTVRMALKEQYSALEEGKADILGLYLITQLTEMGELENTDLMDNYITFMAGIFRSVRFGAANSHGKANMIRFNYFQEKGAFTKDPLTGTYRVNFELMKEAMNNLATKILLIQGNGDYEAAKKLVDDMGVIGQDLQNDLNKLNEKEIPVDIVFNQGPSLVGLQ